MRYKFPCLKQCLMTMVFCVFFTPAHAAPFAKGDVSVSLVLGSGQAFNDNYSVVGAGVGYYVLDGLRLGISGQRWLGGDILINKYSPQVQYVMARDEKLKPYLGVFYHKTSIEGFDDLDAAGGRAGVYLSGRGNYYISVGIVHEYYLSCDEVVYVSCSDTYPELTVTFSL
ncbi:MAG: hypothetical protein OEY06_06335 [Gammaproteobacteria bacterium]|nr:hypothetical protein [Gammaproteobacteria bacterium]